MTTESERAIAAGQRLAGRIGFSIACLPNRSIEEALEDGARTSLSAVELLAFDGYRHSDGQIAGVYFDRIEPAQVEQLREAVSGFRHLSVHAPFWEVACFSPNPAIMEASRRQMEETVRVSGLLGAETVVTHVAARPGYSWDEYRGSVIDFYRKLGDVAQEGGLTVTIETGFPPGIEDFAALVHEIDHECVGATVDVGHLRGLLTEEQRLPDAVGEAYNALLREHLRSLGERIYHLHLHDVRASGLRDHWECGSGIIDYEALFALLLAQGYDGLVIFELQEPDDIAALEGSRDRTKAALDRAKQAPAS